MSEGDGYSAYFADDYERLARECEWFGNELCFGLMYEYVEPGQLLLDMGVGTGLGARLYKRAGLTIHGLDVRQDMLDECERRGIADVLSLHDLNDPLPYGDGSFDHVISIGVFHFFERLEHLMGEAARVLRPGGHLAITVGLTDSASPESQPRVVTGHTIYDHPDAYVLRLAGELGLEELKRARFQGYADEARSELHTSRVFVLARSG